MKSDKEIHEMHGTWYSFCEKFGSGVLGDSFDELAGGDVMDEVEEWAKKFPDVKITRCDDNHHAGSLLVLIPHPKHGVTVLFIPQLTNEKHYFFLYPSQQKALIEALESIKIVDPYDEMYEKMMKDSLGFKDFVNKEKEDDTQ